MIALKVLVPLILASFVGAAPMNGNSSETRVCKNLHTVTVSTVVTSTTSRVAAPSSPPTTPSYSPTSLSSPGSVSPPPASNTGGVPGQPNNSGNPSGGYRNVLYFGDWTNSVAWGFSMNEMPVDKVTHVLYAFADIKPNGEVFPYSPVDATGGPNVTDYVQGCVKQLYELKKQNRHLKTMLSIGGWTLSDNFTRPALTEAGRQRFATSSVQLMLDWGMDGLDIDWEYPENQQEATALVALLKACREELERQAKQHADEYHFELTVACPAGPKYELMDLKGMDPYLDAWNLMAYDFAGNWSQPAAHQANLRPSPDNPQSTPFNVETALGYYFSQGIRKEKMVLGMPLYGRSFIGTDGPGSMWTSVANGSKELGTWLYKDLPRPGNPVEIYDAQAGALYSYDAGTREMVTYDNVESAGIKADYILQKGLGGAMYWEASGDKQGEQSIVRKVANSMGPLDMRQNLLSYPSSQYNNIRNNVTWSL